MEPITRAEQFLARAAGNSGEDLTPLTRQEHFLKEIADAVSGETPSTAVDNALSDSSENPVQNKVVKAAIDGKADALTVVDVSGSTPSVTPEANKVYECDELTSLTITNPPTSGAYSIVFTSGSVATDATIPSTILGLENFDPEANTIYEINVLNNRAVIGSWAVSR